jgi:hypothetical protein
MTAGRQGQAKAVLSEVQTRHDDIKHIEKTIIVRKKTIKTTAAHYFIRNCINFLWTCR